MGPRAATAAIARAIELSSLTSHTKPSPAAEVAVRVSPATLRPAAASSDAMAAPMPRLAPVTRTEPGLTGPSFAVSVRSDFIGCSVLVLGTVYIFVSYCPKASGGQFWPEQLGLNGAEKTGLARAGRPRTAPVEGYGVAGTGARQRPVFVAAGFGGGQRGKPVHEQPARQTRRMVSPPPSCWRARRVAG